MDGNKILEPIMGLWRYLVLGTMKDFEQIKAEV